MTSADTLNPIHGAPVAGTDYLPLIRGAEASRERRTVAIQAFFSKENISACRTMGVRGVRTVAHRRRRIGQRQQRLDDLA
jgi:hypothetical protein